MAELQTATLASGCFWCTEAVFKEVQGVEDVTSGYAGGTVENPKYEELHTQDTGHAEAIQLKFDPDIITYTDILNIFFATHDPTTLNRQGNDVGTMYRSVIFCHNDEQKKTAEQVKDDLEKRRIFDKPIVTSVEEYKNFYPAEGYHQDYYEKNPGNSYCSFIITPKVAKFRKEFRNRLKITN